MLQSKIPWPGGARCAISISWDIDIDTTIHLERPETGYKEYGVLSSLRYEEVGIPNVVRALQELGLVQTFFVCGWCLERYPEVCAEIINGGHEVAHHGYLHEPPSEQSPEREWELLGKGVEIIKRFTGSAPQGWRAPYGAFSDRSGAYLARAGFRYDSSLLNDHDPFLLRTESGTVLELPIDITMSDAPHYSHVPQMGYPMSPKPPREAVEYFMSTFDATYRIGGFATTIWHPEISGRPSRLLAWVDMVRDLQERGDVWIAPLRDIAEHVLKMSDAGEVALREVRVPFYTRPISELERP